MKNPNLKLKSFLILILALSLLSLFATCKDEDPPDNDPPQPHQSAITAFGRTITVTGDASISTADFNTAVGNLESALNWLNDLDDELDNAARAGIAVMLDRPGFQIIIKTGNAGPDADANKSLTIGVDYLKSNDNRTIAKGVLALIDDNAFANLTIIDNTNGLAFDGKVTIKTGDPYTVADWNALVANVITAFNAAYTNGNTPHKNRCETVFANNANAQIVLVNNLANNWEVRNNEFNTLYLKTDSIATAAYRDAVAYMDASTPEVG
jgi:hypothetical protein